MTKRKKMAVYASAGCGVLVLIACCAAGMGMYVCKSGGEEPRGYAKAFFKDLREGRYDDAYKRMSGAYQATHDPADFRARVTRLRALGAHTDASLSSAQVTGKTAEISGHLSTAGGDVPVTIQLSEEIGHWYVDWVEVDGQRLR